MMSLKAVIVLVYVCGAVWAEEELTEEQLKKITEFHKECKSETNIDDEVASGVLQGKFPDDPTFKQHMFCMSKKFGTQNEAGEVQKDKVKEKIAKVVKDEAKAGELADGCAVQKDTPEDTAYEMVKCVYEAKHK